MATNINIIDVGLAPNDGNGDTLRESFIKVNQNFTTIKTFIENPSFTDVEITDTLSTETVDAEDIFVGHKLMVTAETISESTSTGAVVIAGGLGVGDVIHGDIVSVNQSTTNLSANVANLQTLGVSSDASITGNLTVGGNTEITGNLTVFGQTTTITTTNLAIKDPQIELGKPDGGSLSYNDGIARGVLGYWYDDSTTSQQAGFFGISTTGELIFTPRDGQTGALGTARFDTVAANVLSLGTSTFNVLTANTINGTVATAAQPSITSLGTLTGLDVTGNVNLDGNAYVTNGMVYINGSPVITSATSFSGGTVPNPTIFTNTTNSTSPTTGAVRVQGGIGIEKDVNVAGTITTGNITVTGDLNGVLSTNAQPNITSVGTLTNLSVANTVSAATVSTASVTASGAVSAATLSASLGITGTLQSASQPNITTVGTLTNLSVSGTITGNINGSVGAVSPSTGAFTTLSATSGVTGTLQTAAQPNITSVGNLTSLTVVGNVYGGNFSTAGNVAADAVTATTLTGTLQTPAQPNITSVGGLTSLTVNGITTVGQNIMPSTADTKNIGAVGTRFATIYVNTVNASGSITANAITSASYNGAIGTVTPNNATFANVTVNGIFTAPNFVSSGSSFDNPTITGGTADGTVIGQTTAASGRFTSLEATSGITGTLLTASQTGITAVGTLTNLSVTNTINGTCQNVVTNANMTGDVTSVGNATTIGVNKVTNSKLAQMTTHTVKGNANGVTSDPQDISMTQLAGMLPTFGTSKGLVPGVPYSITQFLRADGSWVVPDYYTHPAYTTQNVTATGATVIATFTSDAIGSVTGITTRALTLADLGYTGATNANYITNTNQLVNGSGYITSSASITGSASTVTAASQPNITSVGTLTSLTTIGNVSIGEDLLVSGNLTVNGTTTTLNVSTLDVEDLNITVAKNATTPVEAHGAGLTVAGANATLTYTQSTDRWTMNKSLTVPFVYGTAITAQYADLAEKYQSDAEYEPGTVLIFGGSREVTVTGTYADPAVAGVVSTNPAYVMNSEETHSVTVALRGKVPVKVIGPVRKGDLLVTSYIAGHAESVGKETKYGVSVFAKAIEEDLSTGKKVINAVII